MYRAADPFARATSIQIASPDLCDVPNLVREYFKRSSAKARPRIFLCCVTGRELAVAVDKADKSGENQAQGYANAFVLTMCGHCQRQTAPGWMDVGNADNSNALPSNLRIHLDEGMIRDWQVFRSVAEYCNEQITATTQIINRDKVVRELQGVNAQIYSAVVTTAPDEKTGRLQVTSSLDVDFL